MNLKTLSSEGKIAYLIKPILKVLQEAGGQLERSEIKERIADMDDQIAEYSVLEKKSKQTGNTYKEFNFKFNFAIFSICALIHCNFFRLNNFSKFHYGLRKVLNDYHDIHIHLRHTMLYDQHIHIQDTLNNNLFVECS